MIHYDQPRQAGDRRATASGEEDGCRAEPGLASGTTAGGARLLLRRGLYARASHPQSRRHGGRYEYRIWPLTPHASIPILHRSWAPVEAERRADIYLLQPSSEWVLAKLRDGRRLEIKRLQGRVGAVEHWTVPVSAEFPLSPADRGAVAQALNLPCALPASSGMTAAHLLAALSERVIPRTVRKSRLLFRAGRCRAEIARVAIDNWSGHTVALEAPDIPAIAQAISELEFATLPNRAYGEVLLRFVTLSPERRCLPQAGPAAAAH